MKVRVGDGMILLLQGLWIRCVFLPCTIPHQFTFPSVGVQFLQVRLHLKRSPRSDSPSMLQKASFWYSMKRRLLLSNTTCANLLTYDPPSVFLPPIPVAA